jgi:hypothetical protein
MMLASKEFADMGYTWIAIDSLTELSDLLEKELKTQFKGEKNGFALWAQFKQDMIGSLKWIRDLPYHVLVTCLAKDEEDDNGNINFWPHVAGKAVAKQIPALFDHVFAGVRHTTNNEDGTMTVHRMLYCDEVHGYHGKIRDARQRVPSVLHTSNIASVIKAMHSSDEDFNKWINSLGE